MKVEAGNPRESFGGFMLSLADADKFEELVKSEAQVTAKGSFRYAMGEKDGIVAWTKDVALFGFSNAQLNLVEQAQQILTPKNLSPVFTTRSCKTAFAEAHDLTFVVRFQPTFRIPRHPNGFIAGRDGSRCLKDNFITGHLDFLEKGRIEGVADLDLNEADQRPEQIVQRPYRDRFFQIPPQ
ncbi:MAG: hypothetical protein IPJ40_04785 [Saprospirales bacterium]|nr:hypothetical protein [Saprospirales bacterium]